jgi:hypothetical protein
MNALCRSVFEILGKRFTARFGAVFRSREQPIVGRSHLGARKWVLLTIGVIAGLAITAVMHRGSWLGRRYDPVRAKAWEAVAPRLDATDKASAGSIDRQAAAIDEFFDERSEGAEAFADDALSLRGKWVLVRSYLPFTDKKAHDRYLHKSFERRLFRAQELESLVSSALTAFLSEAEGLENSLLVDIRVDLRDGDLVRTNVLPSLHSDEAFRAEFTRMAVRLLPALSRDIGVSIGTFAGSEVATATASKVFVAVAARLGVSGGILGAGAASSWATMGVGLIVAVIIDRVLSWALHRAGYDPAREIAGKVRDILRQVRTLILDGDPQDAERYAKLRQKAKEAWLPWERAECRKQAEKIEASGRLGLRHELAKLHSLRARIRRDSLTRIVLEGGQP